MSSSIRNPVRRLKKMNEPAEEISAPIRKTKPLTKKECAVWEKRMHQRKKINQLKRKMIKLVENISPPMKNRAPLEKKYSG